jgi:hypothetical protein
MYFIRRFFALYLLKGLMQFIGRRCICTLWGEGFYALGLCTLYVVGVYLLYKMYG